MRSDDANTSPAPAVVALMIGELDYMTALNPISTAIVEEAVRMWRQTPGAALICESAPMTDAARRLGVGERDVVTALPQPTGHITRLVALWFARSPYADRPVRLVTHAMHAGRAIRIFRKAGIHGSVVGLDLPFDHRDPDWKLRSAGIFRAYNAAAYVYGFLRGWI